MRLASGLCAAVCLLDAIGCAGRDPDRRDRVSPDASDASEAGDGQAGEAAGAGGAGGTSGEGGEDGSAGAAPTLDDVDLTLGGFNQDMPPPATDCLTKRVVIGCLAVSGEYNGHAFDFACEDRKVLVGEGVAHVIGCMGQSSDGTMNLELQLDHRLLSPVPLTFEKGAPEAYAFANLRNADRQLKSYHDREFEMFLLSDTHEQKFAVAGISEHIPKTTSGADWRVEGAFAYSLSAKPGCTPNETSFGCDTIRLRANFRAFFLEHQ